MGSRDPATFRPSWASYFVFYTAAAIFILAPLVNPRYKPLENVLFVVAAAILAFVVLRRQTTSYRWEEEGLVVNNGFPFSKDRQVPFRNIASVKDYRGLTQRALGIGNVCIELKSPPDTRVMLYGIRDPLGMKERILSRIQTE